MSVRNENIPLNLDDEYWKSFEGIMERRQGYFNAMHNLDELSKRLSEEAYREYLQREALNIDRADSSHDDGSHGKS